MTRLLDRTEPPNADAFRQALGVTAALWEQCRDIVVDRMGASSDVTWNGRSEGWALRFRRAGRPFLTLAPRDEGFTGLVILGRAETTEAEGMALSPRIRALLDGARRYPDGTWLFIPVEQSTDVDDILGLLTLKLPPTIRRRVAAAA